MKVELESEDFESIADKVIENQIQEKWLQNGYIAFTEQGISRLYKYIEDK
jgi:hypothetical protein